MSFARVGVHNVHQAMNYEKNSVMPGKQGKDYLDNVFKQERGQEHLYPLPRSGENPFQLMHLLQTLDEQRNSRVSDLTTDHLTERIEEQPLVLFNNASSEMNVPKRSIHTLKDSGIPVKGTRNTSGETQPVKIPDAVVALAQAAAKANGETEKYLPGWPLFSQPKVQLHKCAKCSREFCSSINFRRHTRVHRRSLKIDKDFPKNRDYLGAFWDKLTVDQAKEILSLADVVIEGVGGSSIVRALSTWMCKPGFASLPLAYAKAGSALLDIIQAKASRLPISSKELFNMLDDASEKTFLCTNTAACIQKFLFDGEAEKVALELKNVVACTSYMLERKLVESWCADKAAEALRCQKLLVEEEEAAQKRQAELMERKHMKKLRQKEQKLKDLKDEDVKLNSSRIVEDARNSPIIQSPKATSEPDWHTSEDPECHSFPANLAFEVNNDLGLNLPAQDVDHNLGRQMHMKKGDQGQATISRRPLVGPAKHCHNGFIPGSIITSRHSALTRHANYNDPTVTILMNGHKTWTRKIKPEIEENCSKDKVSIENGCRAVPGENSEVLIGSISVTLEDNNEHLQDALYSKDWHYQEKLSSSISSSSVGNHPAIKLWRPVSHDENEHPITISSSSGMDKKDDLPSSTDNKVSMVGSNSCFNGTDEGSFERYNCSTVAQTRADLHGARLFSRREAAAFLSERWKEAIASDHVKLVLPSETEASDCCCSSNSDSSYAAAPLSHTSSDSSGRSILGSTENQMGVINPPELAAAASKLRFRPKPENNCKLKYVPKQK